MIKDKIVLFNINIFKKAQIEELCNDLGIGVITASASDGTRSLENIVSGINEKILSSKDSSLSNNKLQNGTSAFTDEMMVFCGILPEKLDRFLAAYRKREIQPVELKAVMTPFNTKWTAVKLCDELKKERAQLMSK